MERFQPDPGVVWREDERGLDWQRGFTEDDFRAHHGGWDEQHPPEGWCGICGRDEAAAETCPACGDELEEAA